MAGRLKVLNCIANPHNRAGFEVAAAFAAYAAEGGCAFESELWVPGAADSFAGVPNRAAGVRCPTGPRCILALRRLLLAEPPALIHCHDVPSATTVALARTVTHTPPAVLSVYAPLPRRTPRKPLRDVRARAFLWSLRRAFGAVVAPSAYAREIVISRSGFSPGKVTAIPFGIEPPDMSAAGAKSGSSVDVALLPIDLRSGRRRAAILYFLQSAALILRGEGDAAFLLPCCAEDESYVQAALVSMALSHRVTVSASQSLFGTLASADIAVLPTGDFEGIRPLVHAMAAGKAIIAPDLRGVREFVEPETTGLLIRPNDAQALADAVLRLSSSLSERTRLALAASAAARSRFSSRRLARSLCDLYSRLTGQ